ncbi:hypothetical protein [Methylococcus capsulatus]|uniref:hypothetical protein n=1 Tax=Methylococcus capsulatus TaxID=414 RepID=UPI001C532010|nr:hypothetical protein [Methylococcus capsulatus]QXP94140.1 hypothetical protein KW113_02670 [Methylococcus capsulatus]
MKRPSRAAIVRGILVALVLLPMAALWSALEPNPLVNAPLPASHAYDGQDLLRARKRGGEARAVHLTAGDIEAAVNDLMARKKLDGAIRTDMQGGCLAATVTLRLPYLAGWFLNIRLTVEDGDPLPAVTGLRVGSLPLPPKVVNAFVIHQMEKKGLLPNVPGDQGLILSAHIRDGKLELTFTGESQTAERLRALITEAAGAERIRSYHDRLANALSESNTRHFIRLGILTRALFALAAQRSGITDPAAENRAVILLLAAYVNGYDLMSGSDGDAQPLPVRSVLLQGRQDLGRHFMTSAAFALAGQRTLTDAIGLIKELNDTHSGSGFSFTDLAADRAGTVFGKRATQPQYARRIQGILAASTDDAVFMPNVGDLPERLRGAEFFERFRDVYSPQFERLTQLIDERIDRLSLYTAPDSQAITHKKASPEGLAPGAEKADGT